MIMLASYTANLAAFLTMDRMTVQITSAEDLVKQTKIQYGAVRSGSTMKFFKHSNFSTYQRMWAAMENAGDSVHTTSNNEGVKRVLRSNYAFMMESVPMEYQLNKNCKLRRVGDLLDSKGYGMALPLSKFLLNICLMWIFNRKQFKIHLIEKRSVKLFWTSLKREL